MVRDFRAPQSNIRDQELLDAIDALPRKSCKSNVWRTVREGANPLTCSQSGGRWDDGTFDVLYTSERREGALRECRFHLYEGQPIPPSKVRYELYELNVELTAIVEFTSLAELTRLGLRAELYGQLSYAERKSEYVRSQEISEACAFLGAEGLRVPSARGSYFSNLVVFCEKPTIVNLGVVQTHGIVQL